MKIKNKLKGLKKGVLTSLAAVMLAGSAYASPRLDTIASMSDKIDNSPKQKIVYENNENSIKYSGGYSADICVDKKLKDLTRIVRGEAIVEEFNYLKGKGIRYVLEEGDKKKLSEDSLDIYDLMGLADEDCDKNISETEIDDLFQKEVERIAAKNRENDGVPIGLGMDYDLKSNSNIYNFRFPFKNFSLEFGKGRENGTEEKVSNKYEGGAARRIVDTQEYDAMAGFKTKLPWKRFSLYCGAGIFWETGFGYTHEDYPKEITAGSGSKVTKEDWFGEKHEDYNKENISNIRPKWEIGLSYKIIPNLNVGMHIGNRGDAKFVGVEVNLDGSK
jgi:hypothetical protein